MRIVCPDCQGKGRVKIDGSVWPRFCDRCNGEGKVNAVQGAEGWIAAPWGDSGENKGDADSSGLHPADSPGGAGMRLSGTCRYCGGASTGAWVGGSCRVRWTCGGSSAGCDGRLSAG
jgi:RecJ-like exonuclease